MVSNKNILALSIVAASLVVAVIPTLSMIKAQQAAQLPANENQTGNTNPNPPTATQLPTIPFTPNSNPNPPTASQLPVLPNPNHLPVQTFQDDHEIVTVVTKSQKPTEGPIIVIPPKPGEDNSTILTPGENITAENPGNITIIKPDGNVTEIENGNVTQPDNETIIIAPPDRNITETPGNVTVIDPPAPAQLPAEKPCTCNQTPASSIPPVRVMPAPGQNITTINPPQISQLPTFPPAQPPTSNQSPTESNNTGGNNTASNQTASDNTPKVNPLTPTAFVNLPYPFQHGIA